MLMLIRLSALKKKIKLETNDKKFECNYFFNSFGYHDSNTFLNQMLLQFGALARMNMKFFKT